MVKQDAWFIEERAVAFASLVLTKHNGVAVRAQDGAGMAIDLLVEVLKDGKSALRFFGVQLAGTMDLPDSETADERILSHLRNGGSESMLPICAFVIGVRKPEGICRWIVEPVVEDGRALLRRDVEPAWHVLDEEGVGRLIGQVNDWYDVLQGTLTPRRRGRQAKTSS